MSDGMYYLVYFVLPGLSAFAIQLVMLFLSRRRFRPLRFLVLLAPAFLCACAVSAYQSDPGFFIGMNVLAAALILLLAMVILAGWGLAWGVYALAAWRKHRKKSDALQ